MQRINRVCSAAPLLASIVATLTAVTAAASAQNAAPPVPETAPPVPAPTVTAPPTTEPASRLPDPPKPVVKVARMPLAFEANNGQTDRRICFLCTGQTCALYLTREEAMVTLARYPVKVDPNAPGHAIPAGKPIIATVRMSLLNSSAKVDVHGHDPVTENGTAHKGKLYSRVHYPAVYPGVDMVLHADDRCLGYEFTVAPHADASVIGWSVEGARKIAVNQEGELAAQTPAGDLCWDKPGAFQVVDGKRRPVPCSYAVKGHDVRFHLGAYDHNKPLIIAPVPEEGE